MNNKEIIAIVGAGTMGAGIAQVVAGAGHPVVLHDQDDAILYRARNAIESSLSLRVERNRMSEREMKLALANITNTPVLDDVASAALVIEAIAEQLEVKTKLFKRLEAVCPAETVFATNTSSLSITEIGAVLENPGRLVGLHFFNPATVMKLVEVVSGMATTDGTAQRVERLATSWGKKCVRVKSSPGFIVNRVARPFYAEALRLLQEQAASVATIDAIMRESGGFRMGPFELMDLIGHDINYAVTNSVYNAYFQDSRFKPSLQQKELIDAGYLGRKSGVGFYDYRPDAETKAPHTEVVRTAPKKVLVRGDLGVAAPIAELIANAGIDIEYGSGAGQIEFDQTVLALTDGRSATERSTIEDIDNLVLFDLALDYQDSKRTAIARGDRTTTVGLERAAGLFQKIGKSVSVIDDAPGMVVMRTVCMLANEGADAVGHGVCDAAAVDSAMQHGAGYPLGPLAWAERLGISQVVQTLQGLQHSYGEDRYRVSSLLRRRAHSGLSFHD